MDEAEWLACNDPGELLGFVRSRVSERKLWLFACALCRPLLDGSLDERSRLAFDTAERFADGEATREELAQVAAAAIQSEADARAFARTTAGTSAREYGVGRVWATALLTSLAHSWEASWQLTYDPKWTAGCAFQSTLLRDIIGNPFHSLTLDLTWRTSTVLALAEAAYENRALPAGTLDPQRLSVLADSLEESGCSDAEIVGHLRSPGPHVRGCAIVDLILGKM